MEIKDRLQEVIEDNDLNIGDLANYIGVNRKQIQRWQSGTAEMGIYKLKAICQYTGISADYILGLPKDMKWPR